MITITIAARTVGMTGTLAMRCAAEPPSRNTAVQVERGGKECGSNEGTGLSQRWGRGDGWRAPKSPHARQ